ncbi:MAG: tetratricopeptide repeat protein, partial [Bacteroidota bacterium]
MKFIISSLIYILVVLFSISTFAQNGVVNIDSIPEMDKASAMLDLAKSNYTSNYALADEYSAKAMLVAEENGQKKELGIANKYLGITNYFRRDFESALLHYKKALTIFEELGDLKEQANVINNIALVYSDMGNLQESVEYHQKSLKIREELNDAKGIIGSLNNIGNLYQKKGEYENSLIYYQKGIEISKLVFPNEPILNLYGNMAKSHAKLGNINQAQELYLNSLESSKESGNIRTLIVEQTNIANLYYELGSAEKAISYLTDALNTTIDNNLEYLEAMVKLNIGNIYFQTEQYEKAAEFYGASLPIYQKTQDYEGEIKALINVALTNDLLGNNDTAQEGFLQARKIAEQLEEPSLLAMTANYLGKHYLTEHKYKSAEKWFNKSINVASINNITRELYMANYSFGLYWFELSDYEKALFYYKNANQIAKQMKSVRFEKDASEGLWKTYEKLQLFNEAFSALKEFNVLKDSIFNDDKQAQIRSIEGKLNLKMKESQIADRDKIIQQQKEILSQSEKNKIYIIVVALLFIGLLIIGFNRQQIKRQKERAELIQQNLTVEHDLLQLQMNPHFIFNALNSIQSFISENNELEAELFLAKFARLMRYYLDSSSQKWVDFTNELQALELNLE